MPSRPSPKSAPRPLPFLALSLDELVRPSFEQEARLLRAAERIWALSPWKTWSEDHLFVVSQPVTGELGFVSVIGGSKQQFGVIVYRGADAYFSLLDFVERASSPMPDLLREMFDQNIDTATLPADLGAFIQQMGAPVDPMELLRIPQLQLNFDTQKDLDSLDLECLKRHSYRAKGRAFPNFRALVPGYLPWWISQEDAALLTFALEQLVELCARPGFDPQRLTAKESGTRKPVHELFARLPKTAKNGETTWSDARLKVSPGDGGAYAIELDPDEELLERIAALPQGQTKLEMELVSLPSPLGGETERPCFPSLLLAGSGGQVVAGETIPCGAPSPYLFTPLLNATLKILAEQKERPLALQFASPEMSFLGAVGEMIEIPVQMTDELETLDPAIEALMAHLQGGLPQ